MALLQATVNARASNRIVRCEPLGIDIGDRTYYALSYHPINDDTRAPLGWASGVLVWGAVPARSPDDDLPASVARWSHFGSANSVRHLVKWLEWEMSKIKPVAPRKKKPIEPGQNRSRASSVSGSELSSLPDDDLLLLFDPPGYQRSTQKRIDDGRELSARLLHVAQWLQVLEWKGLVEDGA